MYSNAAIMDIAYELKRECEKMGLSIKINEKQIGNSPIGVVLEIIPKKNTTISNIKRMADDIVLRLKTPNLHFVQEKQHLYFVIDNPQSKANYLPKILKSKYYQKIADTMSIPCPVGIRILGQPLIMDLADFPHAMVCGTTQSGKTCALKSLLITLLNMKPNRVNLIIADMAGEFSQFCDFPHLSCPPIKDFKTFLLVVSLLKDEMERRINLKGYSEYDYFPPIVMVVDEFQSFTSTNNGKKKQIT